MIEMIEMIGRRAMLCAVQVDTAVIASESIDRRM
jgi:hypothetical protein